MLLNEMKRILVKMYVENELADQIGLIVDGYEPHPLGVSIQNGMDKVVAYNNIYSIPIKGMIYENGNFIDGENGETFRNHFPARDIDYDLFIFLKNNIVLDFWLVPSKHPVFEKTIAILKSNPTFEIEE